MKALAGNIGAQETDVYVFSNAPDENSSYDKAIIPKIRKDIQRFACQFHSFELTEREVHTGPNGNMYPGIDDIVGRYGRVIVLEDDIVTAKGFLNYMNQALEQFQSDPDVFSICAYNPVCMEIGIMEDGISYDSFSYEVFRSWGWGIWADRWALLKEKKPEFTRIDLEKVHSQGLMYISAIRHDIIHPGICQRYLDYDLAVRQMAGHQTVIYPVHSMCDNIGMNDTGQTCAEYEGYCNLNFDPEYEKGCYRLSKLRLDKNSCPDYFFQFRQQEFAMKIYREKMFGRDYLYSLFYFGLSRLYLNGGRLGDYFKEHRIETVLVYGAGTDAELAEKLLCKEGITVSAADGCSWSGDAVLVTELERFDAIEESIWAQTKTPVLSVDDMAAWCLMNMDGKKRVDHRVRLHDFPDNHARLSRLVNEHERPVHQGIGLFWDIYYAMFWIFASGHRLGDWFLQRGYYEAAIYDEGYAASYLREILLQDGIRVCRREECRIPDVLVVTDVRRVDVIKAESEKQKMPVWSLYDVVMEAAKKLL